MESMNIVPNGPNPFKFQPTAEAERIEMRPITDQLRAYADNNLSGTVPGNLMRSAADEIDRLRAELLRLQEVVCEEDHAIIERVLNP